MTSDDAMTSDDVVGSDAQAAHEPVVVAWAREAGVPCEPGRRRGEYVVSLPGEHKLATAVSVVTGPHGTSVTAFVVRRPDEDVPAVHAWLLRRNTRLPGVAFAIDPAGDVYLVGRLPAGGTIDDLDALLGAVLAAADDSFDELLTLGFHTAITREWAWRIDRGESTANLAAFEHLRPATAEPQDPTAG